MGGGGRGETPTIHKRGQRAGPVGRKRLTKKIHGGRKTRSSLVFAGGWGDEGGNTGRGGEN